MSDKVKNNSKLKYMNEFPIIIMIVVAIIVIILAMMYLSIKPYGTIYTNGYMVLSGNMTYNLITDMEKNEELNIGVASVTNGDYLYKQMDNYYVGVEKKVKVEYNYPVYSSDGLTIYNLNDNVILIDRNFEKLKGYPGLSLNYGILYNSDEETPADDIDYLFLDLNNSVYINAQTMVIKTLTNEYTIAMNSPVYFNTSYINYYIFDGKKFVFNNISDINYESIIKIGDVTLTYREFLLQMNLAKMDEFLEIPEEEKQEEEIPKEDLEEKPNTESNEENNEVIVEYVKPTVKSSDFIGNVYSAAAELTIEDPAGVITSNPMFEVYTMDDKLYSRNRFSGSGKAKITGLSSNTEYKIIGTYKYNNKEGVSIVSTFYEGVVKTKDITNLEEIKITSELGDIYSNQIEIKDLNILNIDSEVVTGIKKIVINVWKEDSNDIKKFEFAYSQIRKLKSGEKVVYNTPSSLNSSTAYEYELKFYDKDDNELKATGNISGFVKTSKQAPKVDFSLNINTKRNEVSINVKTKNEDDIYIKDYKYQLFTNAGILISEGELDYSNSSIKELFFDNLDYNSNYILRVTGIYDLEDGNSTRELKEEKSFTTVNLKDSFVAWYDDKTLEVTHNSISTDIYISSTMVALEKDDTELIIYLVDSDGNIVKDETGNLVQKKYSKEEYTNSNSSNFSVKTKFENLKSDTEYKIKTKINIKQFNEVIFVEKELNPSIKTKIEHSYIKLISKKLLGRTLSANLEVVDNDNLLSDYVKIEIYSGKIDSESDIKQKPIYTKNYRVKNRKEIIFSLNGYTEDSYTIFVSSEQYNNVDIKQYIPVEQKDKNKSTSINIDRNFYGKLEMYQQLTSDNKNYDTQIRFRYKLFETVEDIYLIDCVDNNCVSVGYFKGGKDFEPLNNSGATFNEDIIHIQNSGSATHKLYAAMPSSPTKTLDKIKNETSLNVDNAYILDSIEYDTTTPIYNISSADDLYEIDNKVNTRPANPDKPTPYYTNELSSRYVVTENIDLRNKISYNRELVFGGVIDFQGYWLQLYSDKENVFTVFRTLSTKGKISNAVLYYYLNYDGVVESLPGFIYTNNGKIEDIIINVKQCYFQGTTCINQDMGRAKNIGLLAYENKGLINNFVVNLNSDIHTYGTSSLLTVSNSGTGIISNGYINSENNGKIVVYDNTSTHGTVTSSNSGLIKNIYNLVSVASGEESYSGEGMFTFVRNNNNSGIIKNTISVATTPKVNENGPNVRTKTGKVLNNFYVDTNTNHHAFKNQINKNIGIQVLANTNFWELILNSKENDGDNMFSMTPGYYPLLKMSDFMIEKQTLKPIPYNIKLSKLDVLSSAPIEGASDNRNSEKTAKVMVYINNPYNTNNNKIIITSMSLEGLTTKVDLENQKYNESSQISEVPITVEIGDGKAQSSYYVNSFTYEVRNEKNEVVDTGKITYENETRTIDVDMYRHISSYQEFINSINSNENIYLVDNIVSPIPTKEQPILSLLPKDYVYTGKLDGNGKTLNIENLGLIERGYYLFKISETIVENLKVTGMRLKTVNNIAYVGFIGYVIDSHIDNLDISESEILMAQQVNRNDPQYIGGLAGDAVRTDINKVSVNNLKITQMEHTGKITNIFVGGVVGISDNSVIENTYVYNLNINNLTKDVVYGETGVGGIVGYGYSGSITSCYSEGEIKADYNVIGGIVGKNNSLITKNNYSYMYLDGDVDYMGGIIGILINNPVISDNMFIGHIENNKNAANVSQIVPSSNSNVSALNYVLKTENKYKNFKVIDGNFSIFDQSFEKYNNDKKLPYLKNSSLVFQSISEKEFKNLSESNYTYTIEYFCKNENSNYSECSNGDEYATAAKVIFKDKTGNEIPIKDVKLLNEELTISDDGLLLPKKYLSDYEVEINDEKIKLIVSFYRQISSVDDWKKISTTQPENVILLNDINFENNSEEISNKKINNLLGNNHWIGISNDNNSDLFEINENLIYSVVGTLQDVKFQNIKIITKTGIPGVGVIRQNEGIIKNVDFDNITILADKTNMAALVAINQGWINSSNINDKVNIKNIKVQGENYVGALVGYNSGTITAQRIYNVVAKKIEVIGDGNVGGIAGYSTAGLSNIDVSNVVVSGNSNIGGIAGQAVVSNSKIEHGLIYLSGQTNKQSIGGIGGSVSGTLDKLEVLDVAIVQTNSSKAPSSVGGIYGKGTYFTNCNVEKLIIASITNDELSNIFKEKPTNYYEYIAENINYSLVTGNSIGGISGSNIVRASYNKIFDVILTGKTDVGGISGFTAKSQWDTNGNVVSNAHIYAETNAGGLYGRYPGPTDSTQSVYNNMVLYTEIHGGYQNVGGIIGNIGNDSVFSQNMKFYGNLALAVNLFGGGDSLGGLIGYLYQVPSSIQINFKNSLFYDMNNNNYPLIGKIENPGTGALSGYGTDILDVETFANKSNFKEYVASTTIDSRYQINSIESLSYFMSETDKVNLKFPNNDTTKFPVYIGSSYPKVPNYVDIPKVGEVANIANFGTYGMSRVMRFANSYRNPISIDFDVYASGVNTINIEFSETDESSYFYYKVGNYVSNSIPIEKRVYTLTYDFKTPINIYISNNSNYKEKTIYSKDLAKTVSLINDKTYYINNNTLYSETKMITGNFKNLYGEEALTSDGEIYNLITKQVSDSNIDYGVLLESKPIYEFTYKGNNIKTYYNYSLVNGEIKDLQLFIKNGMISTINSSLSNKKDMYIIDHYNNNEIQIILKSDGKLYNIKDSAKYPDDFVNSKINELYTDIDSTSNIAVLKYSNGEVYTFDYRTGKLLFSNVSNENLSIFDYIKNKTSISKENHIVENINGHKKYSEIESLKNKFIEVSIEEANDKIHNSNNFAGIKDDYVVVYNGVTQNYDLFKTSTLLGNKSAMEPETDKIYKDYELVKFYKTLGKDKKEISVSGIVLFATSIILILISLVLLIKNKINKREVKI